MAFEGMNIYPQTENLTYLPYFLVFVIFISISWNLCSSFIKRRRKLPPGPTGLPWVGYLPFLGTEPYKTLWKMKEKYGDIIGLKFGSRYTVVINDASVAKEVLSHIGSLDRPPDLFKHVGLGFGDSNGEKWIEQRRFSMSITRDLGLGKSSWEDLVLEEVHDLADEIRKSGGKPMDLSKTLPYSVTSNIISLLMGRKLSKKDDANKIKLCLDFADLVFSYVSPSDPTTVMPILRKLLVALNIGGYSKAAESIKTFGKFVNDEVLRHKNSHEQNDFINSYLNKLNALANSGSNTQHFFSEEMLEGNVTVLFLGASDTITSSLRWLFWLMADHKAVQDRIFRELMEVIGKDGAVKYEERLRVPYTFAVLMESQRFSSIVPFSTTRKANQDIPIRDYIIPKGTEITVNLWGLHNDPKYWKEPNKFTPGRFLTEDGTKLIKQPESFAPFSYGRRMCPGETVAWMEILAYFTHTVRNYEISFPPGEKPECKSLTGLVERLVPYSLCFKERN